MSRIESVLDVMRKTHAEEMRLEAGQRIYVLRGGERKDVGREPVTPAALDRMAVETLGPDGLQRISESAGGLRHICGEGEYEAEFQRRDGSVVIIIRRVSAAPAESASEAEKTQPGRMPARIKAGAADVTLRHAVDPMLQLMVTMEASDLHLASGSHPVMRVHGEIHFLNDRPILTPPDIEKLVREILSERQREEFDQKGDVDFGYEVPGLARFRVNVFKDRKGAGAAMRLIPIAIVPLEELGLPDAVRDLCYLPKGLVVVTGPTGSGKSTTLAAMVDFVNKTRSDHIITIEDPIEFVHENKKCLVNQREVGNNTASFKSALRAALREDPDVVLVGEMRDLETTAIAIETAETGHLVFATLHTSSAVSTVDRIIDQFPPDQQAQIRVMLSDSLRGILAQMLCRKIAGGRVAAFEILLSNSAVSSLIREGKTYQLPSVMQTSKKQGMITMNDSLLALVKGKVVEPREAWMKSMDKNGLMEMLRGAGIQADSFTL